MELGVCTGASIEAGPRTACTGAPQRAITEYILGLADDAGFGAALIDADRRNPGTDSTVITWPQFAHTVRAAARGLSRRGLQDTDTVGVFVQDAVSHAVAVHAVRAAGAIAVPVHLAAAHPAHPAAVQPAAAHPAAVQPAAAHPAAVQPAAVADIAAQLKACRARLLITSAGLAELAVQAAERSWVRQVFAFGEVTGTTPFSSLLEAARHGQPAGSGVARTAPGSAPAQVPDLAGLRPAAGPGPRLTARDVVVAGPPCGRGDAYSALVDLALTAGATIVAAPLPRIAAAVQAYKGTAAIVPRGTHVPGIPAERVFTVA